MFLLATIASLVQSTSAGYVYTPMVYTPMVYGNNAPSILILDKLPKDSVATVGLSRSHMADTLAVSWPETTWVYSAANAKGDRLAITGRDSVVAWADSVAETLRSSLMLRISRTSRIDSNAVSIRAQTYPQPLSTGDRTTILIESVRIEPVWVGTNGFSGYWRNNAVVKWSIWDGLRSRWHKRCAKSVRNAAGAIKEIPAAEAAEILASAIYSSLPGSKITDAKDLSRVRRSAGGLHILARASLEPSIGGDSPNAFSTTDDAKVSANSMAIGLHVEWIPSWYGVGITGEVGQITIGAKDTKSAAIFDRKNVYLNVMAHKAILESGADRSSTDVFGALSLGWAQYRTNELFTQDVTLSGQMVRPEIGIATTNGAFSTRTTLGIEFVNVGSTSGDWEDKFFHMGVEMGFRALTE